MELKTEYSVKYINKVKSIERDLMNQFHENNSKKDETYFLIQKYDL